ncbi:hypothetical protein BCR37DRAFT_345949 [Protomyces lactucae-debilis]|uniref:RRM domain-containing protein n=1 Tax=Protomyces lactucae-debilis TaxID=2754530 RepID=A0A1Y2FKH6_PROLT|nr:uncharacterized protein BCR37DRAFT_345949 [Protomyces lactucae-debilis]ORY83864.1 hypothetical protein BCR37DRAFT_345949 [Protomyces lactucae-debilis]
MFSLLRHSARLASKASAAHTAQFSLTTKALEKNLYLGNLSWTLTPDTLRSAIAQHGHLQDLNIITDRLSGRSRGYGFLRIDDDQVGEQVLAALAECEVEGRQINCREAESRPAFGAGGGGGGDRPRRPYDGGERRSNGYNGGSVGGSYGGRNAREGGDRRGGSGGYGERRGNNDRGGRRGDGYGESRDY